MKVSTLFAGYAASACGDLHALHHGLLDASSCCYAVKPVASVSTGQHTLLIGAFMDTGDTSG